MALEIMLADERALPRLSTLGSATVVCGSHKKKLGHSSDFEDTDDFVKNNEAELFGAIVDLTNLLIEVSGDSAKDVLGAIEENLEITS